MMSKIKGVMTAACVASVVLALTGCSNNKKQTDLAMQEASELREQNATLEQSNRDKDARIAELEQRLASNPQPAPAPTQTWAPAPATVGAPRGGFDAGAGSDFSRNDQGEMAATIAGNLLFASGDATIRAEARRTLDRIARELNGEYRGRAIRIEGHTDRHPIRRSKWASNEQLSQARANAVKEYLSTRGVSAARMSAIGFGSSRLKGSDQASRRVEIVITN